MRRLLFSAALIIAIATLVVAQAPVEQQVLELDKQARAAALRGDASFFERHATDDYVGTNSKGNTHSRSDAITELKSGVLKYTALEYDDVKARVYGDDTVILTAHSTVAGTLNGQDITGRYRVMRVWVKKGGNWRLAAVQSTPVAP
jgi:uncharacterized protein (TIGR02246 family)